MEKHQPFASIKSGLSLLDIICKSMYLFFFWCEYIIYYIYVCVCAHACYFGSFQSPEQTHAKEVGFMDCVFQSTIEFRKWIHHTLLWEMVAKSDSRTSSLLHRTAAKDQERFGGTMRWSQLVFLAFPQGWVRR